MPQMVESKVLSYDSDSDPDMPWDVKRSYSEESADEQLSKKKEAARKSRDPPDEAAPLGLAPSDDEPTRKLVSGKRSLKPLSPPSSKGLKEEKQQRDELEEEDDEDYEEMPMDERSEHVRRRKEALLCVTDDNGVFEGHFCDNTLTAMGEMCGISPTEEEKREKRKGRRSRGTSPRGSEDPPLSLSALKAPYGAEEQTAIEVEYVEPRYLSLIHI